MGLIDFHIGGEVAANSYLGINALQPISTFLTGPGPMFTKDGG